MKSLEECIFSISKGKVKFLENIKLAIFFHPENNTTSINLGSQPIFNPETNRYYSSREDFSSIKKAMENGNYNLEFDRDLRFYLRIM